MTVNLIMSRTANVSQLLAVTMKANGVSTVKLAENMSYSQPLVSKWRSGKASLQFEQIESLLESLPKQSGKLLISILHQVSGGLIPDWVEEKYLYTDPGNLENRVLAEIRQAVTAFQNSTDEFGSPADTIHDLHDPEVAFDQGYDVSKYLLIFMIAIGDYMGWSIQEIQERCLQREAYLKRHKYQIV